MDAARWERIQTLFHAAADRPPPDRLAFLTASCGGDGELLAEVSSLLEEDARGGSLLDREVGTVANDIFGKDAASAPARLGPYRILRVLGEGGMGVVYLAERPDLESQVAVKVLRDAWMSPLRRERFASEQRTLAQLNHPSIARLYDADATADGTPWFVMEYVEGLPITDACFERGRPLDERLQLFRSVCEAVQHAHRHAVIHRDLKPSNILVKSDGSVKLLDFGIAKRLDTLEEAADRTRTGLRFMTPAYASPEQVRGERAGIQTDVYSLGVVLYELLAGRVPFAERPPGDVEPERPSLAARTGDRAVRAGKRAWADLDVLCLTALQGSLERRYRSVEALLRDVDHFLKGEPLEARPDTLRYRVGKFATRNRSAVIAASLALTGVVALVVFFTVRLAKARDAALAQAARTARIQRFMLSLFDGGDTEAGPAETLRVATLLDRGVAQAKTLVAEPAVQAELYETLGGLYQKLGQFDRADALLTSALEQRRSRLGGADAGESLVALGLLRVDQARLEDAEKLVREGLAEIARLGKGHEPALAKANLALGRVLEARGSYDKAIVALDEAVRLDSTSGSETPELAADLSELANVHFYAGHLDLSETLNNRVLGMQRKLYGDRHPLVADSLINLGAIEFERGRYAEAERFDRQALDIVTGHYGKDHYETGSILTMIGRALVSQERYEEAIPPLEDALAIQERVNGLTHPRVASALNDLGRAALKRGRLDEAEARFTRTAAIYRSVYGDGHQLIAVALSNLASVAVEKGDFRRAEALYTEVVERFTRALPKDHLSTGIARVKFGSALTREKRFREAETQSLAGYRILMAQSTPPPVWLKTAKKDLVAIYEGLGQPEKAKEFQTAP